MITTQKEQPFEEVSKPTLVLVRKFRCECGQQYSEQQILQLDGKVYCQQCLCRQLQLQRQQVTKLQQKYIFYKQYEASINTSQLALLRSSIASPQQQQQLTLQEQHLSQTLAQLHKRQHQNTETLRELKQKVLDLHRQESKYWDSINKFEKKLYKLEEKASTAKWELKAANEEMERLQRFNILSEVFKITCDGETGFINGLAIGKRSRNKSDIDWEEVNAGLGHLFVLFCFLVIKFDYTCARMRQRECLGSLSKIKIGGRVFQIAYSRDRQKDFGEILDEWLCELELLKLHIVDKISQKNERIEFPYKIVMGEYKINNEYINPNRIKNRKWDVWTISMKYFLTNFEYLSTTCSLADKYI